MADEKYEKLARDLLEQPIELVSGLRERIAELERQLAEAKGLASVQIKPERLVELEQQLATEHARAQSLQKSLLDEMCKTQQTEDALRATRQELARFRVRAFAIGKVVGYSHSTACLIWGDNGQGGTSEGFAEPLPCTCGALINWDKKRIAELEQANKQAEAEFLKENARVKELEQQLAHLGMCWTCGVPKPGDDCICGGTGNHIDEVTNMRLELMRDRERIAELERQLVEIDDVLTVNWVGPRKDGDYRKALSDLVTSAIKEHDDPAISEIAAKREQQSQRDINGIIIEST